MYLLVVVVFVFLPAICSSQISPAAYREIIKQGFATNYFKTSNPLSKYNDKNIDDIYAKGFRNVRLRSRADLYTAPYDTTNTAFKEVFLDQLTAVVDKCLQTGVAPIISWIHHEAEADATEEHRQNYVQWWTTVAKHLKDKDYELSFNLFTELGVDGCGDHCDESLRRNTEKYNQWTADAVNEIRQTGGKNAERILILGSPGKTGRDLDKIDEAIYKNDNYMLAEWHMYASGPNKKVGGQKYWSGDGDDGVSKENADSHIAAATDFKLLTYLGAWMPTDNIGGALDQAEVIAFARYFASKMKENGIPWSINVLDRFYDTKNSKWLTDSQNIKGALINMSTVLDNIREVM